jgi:hypothetical protein
MKWLLMVVAFVLGAAITWFLTVKRVTRTVPTGDPAAAEVSEPETVPVVFPGGPVAGAVGVGGGADLVAAAGAGVLATEAAGSSDDEGEDDDGGEDDEDEGDDGDEASRFSGAHTPASEAPGPAEAWDRDAEDEDALLPELPDVDPSGKDDLRAGGSVDPEAAAVPVADATPNGDVAGVGEPAAVAAVDEQVEADDTGSGSAEVQDAVPAPEDDVDADVSAEPADAIVPPVAEATPGADGVKDPATVDSVPTGSETTEAQRARPMQGELTFDEPEKSVPPEERA